MTDRVDRSRNWPWFSDGVTTVNEGDPAGMPESLSPAAATALRAIIGAGGLDDGTTAATEDGQTGMTKRALITGITGQDGSYLAELLLDKGYEVHGLVRRSSSFNRWRIDHLYRDPHEAGTRLFLHYADLTDSSSLIGHLHRVKPEGVYNLGAQSHVKVSFEMPEFTAETAGMGTLRILEAVRTADWPIRFYPAGPSEMFGRVAE